MKGLFVIVLVAFVAYTYSQEPSVECPEYDSENATLVRHPCNCNTYYVCFLGSAIPMPCPPNLHFNDEKKVCDFQWRAKCSPLPGCANTLDEEPSTL